MLGYFLPVLYLEQLYILLFKNASTLLYFLAGFTSTVANGVRYIKVTSKPRHSFVHAISSSIRIQTRELLSASPFLSILCDSSTDSASIDEEIVVVRMLVKNQLVFRFLDFRLLEHGSAGGIALVQVVSS